MTKKEFAWFKNWFEQPNRLDNGEEFIVQIRLIVDKNEPTVKKRLITNAEPLQLVGGKWVSERYVSPNVKLEENQIIVSGAIKKHKLEPQPFKPGDIVFDGDVLKIKTFVLVPISNDEYEVHFCERKIKSGYIHDIMVDHSFRVKQPKRLF